MQHSSPRPRVTTLSPLIPVLISAALLAGCAKGDFQEVREGLVRDGIHDWIGPKAAAANNESASSFQLTDDERRLRDLAYPLIEPPYRRKKWNSAFGEYGGSKTFAEAAAEPSAYFNVLMGKDYRSSSARYAQLLDDIHNDRTRLPEFFATATRVIDIDDKRGESLQYIADLPQSERKNALRRIRENAAIVSLVATRLRQRTVSYRYALEQLVVRTPSSEAAVVERSLNELKADIARYEQAPTPTWVRSKSLAAND